MNTYHQIMPISLTNSNDIVANSVSLCEEDSVDNVVDLSLKKKDAIPQIVWNPPDTLNTLQKLADTINKDKTCYSTRFCLLNI